MVEVKRELVRNFLTNRKDGNSFALAWVLFSLLSCFVLSFLYWDFPIGAHLSASKELVFTKHEYYRLFTTTLVHGDLKHFLSNSLMLSIMGYFVSYHFGSKVFPLLGLVAGALINLIVIYYYPPQVHLVGASGVVHWLFGFWFILYLGVQKHVPLTRRFMKVIIVGLVILLPTEFTANISYMAHFVGLVIGFLMGGIYYLINSKSLHKYEEWKSVINGIDPELERQALGDVPNN